MTTATAHNIPEVHQGPAELRIEEIDIRDFRAIGRLRMKLGKVNLVLARNGTGKSSLRAAISALLCGDTEWKGEQYPKLAAHIRSGAEKAYCIATIPGIGKAARRITAKDRIFKVDGWEGTSTEQHDRCMAALGVTADQLYWILHTNRAVEILPKELAQMVNQLSGATTRVTPEAFCAALVQHGIPADLADWTIEQFSKGMPTDPTGAVKHFRDEVYSERRGFNRIVQDAEAKIRTLEDLGQLPEGVGPNDGGLQQERRKRHQLWRDIAVKELAKLEAGGGDLLIARRDQETALRQELRDEITRLWGIIQQAEQLEIERKAIESRAAELKSQADPLLQERAEIETRTKAEVPTCGKCGAECPDCAKAAPQTKAQRKADKARLELLMQELAAIRDEQGKLDSRTTAANEQETDISEAQREFERLQKSIEDVDLNIRDLEAKLKEVDDRNASGISPEQHREKIAKEDAAIEACDAAIRAIEEHDRNLAAIEQAKADHAAKLEQAQELDLLVKKIDQDMVRTLAGSEPAADFGADLNAAVQGMTAGEYSAAVEARDGGLHVQVTRQKFDRDGKPAGHWFTGVPCQVLSESEKFRVGLALQHAILMLVPPAARLLIADGASVLDDENRSALIQFLMDHRELYSQIIITGTVQKDTVSAPVGNSWLKVWWLNRPEDPEVKPGETIEVFA